MTRTGEAVGQSEKFPMSGGRSSLDLAATLGKRHTVPVERIPDGSAFAEWLVLAGVLTADAAAEPIEEGQLRDARELREGIYRLVRAVMAGQPLDDVDVALINDFAARPDLSPQLRSDASAAIGIVGSPVDAALSTIARDAITLLTGPRTARIKECSKPECSLLFFDDSQSGNRRWCSMDRCGNLAKIGGYRKRAKQAGSH
jgi:predicted RNA-binding Zn ribbon-like protein